MELSYVSDNAGNPIAVQIPIADWKIVKENYPNIEDLHSNIPQWQKDLIDNRLQAISENPQRLRPIEELFEEI